MPALDPITDAARIAARLKTQDTLLIACLCAQWCGTCRDYRATFDQIADACPVHCCVWIDIEDHADWFDELDLDVENFPTLLIEDGTAARFFGPVLPHRTVVQRMLADLPALPGAKDAPALRARLAAA
jgi:thiol-disulfide isomerase/thioredoxin